MKSTGIVRKVDDLGRIVLPMELRKLYDVDTGTAMEVFTEEDTIVLRKYTPSCVFCESMEGLLEYRGKKVCVHCRKKLGGGI